MSSPVLDLVAVLHFPQTDRGVFTARCQNVGIRSPTDIGDRSGMPSQEIELAARECFPDHQSIAAICRREQNAVRAEFQSGDPVGVFVLFIEQFTRRRVVDSNNLLGATQGNLSVVRADVCCEDHIVFRANFSDAFAGFQIPENNLTGVRTAATTCHQPLAISGELQDVGDPFRERQHPFKFQRNCVVEENLLMAGNCCDRRPRIHRQGRHTVAATGDQKRVDRQVFRHWGRPGRTLVRDLDLCHRCILFWLGFAAGIF